MLDAIEARPPFPIYDVKPVPAKGKRARENKKPPMGDGGDGVPTTPKIPAYGKEDEPHGWKSRNFPRKEERGVLSSLVRSLQAFACRVHTAKSTSSTGEMITMFVRGNVSFPRISSRCIDRCRALSDRLLACTYLYGPRGSAELSSSLVDPGVYKTSLPVR